ncbi:MAG: hypothetical protein MJ192_05050 [Clostridia bacterium]|nr:hypothetical protein [Clostridia bacterium]
MALDLMEKLKVAKAFADEKISPELLEKITDKVGTISRSNGSASADNAITKILGWVKEKLPENEILEKLKNLK